MIPAEYAQIVWNDYHGVITEIVLVDKRIPSEDRRAAEKYLNWAGHDTMGWPTEGRETPIALFTRIAFSDPQPLPAIRLIVGVFAQIEECDWARIMQAEMLRVCDGNTEESP